MLCVTSVAATQPWNMRSMLLGSVGVTPLLPHQPAAIRQYMPRPLLVMFGLSPVS